MRESRHSSGTGVLAKAGMLMLALFVLIALGLSPLVMQRQMANAGAAQEGITSSMPAMAHAPHQATSGGFCVQMAPCTAIISHAPALGINTPLTARLAPAPVPLAESRALAPPFHPPIA